MLEGELMFQRGHELIEAGPGDAVVLPRGIQHGFAVRSETARVLFACTPGGLEEAFHQVSEPAARGELPVLPAGPPPDEVVAAPTRRSPPAASSSRDRRCRRCSLACRWMADSTGHVQPATAAAKSTILP